MVLSSPASACSCLLEPLEEVYQSAEQVFVAEVSQVELLSKKPRHNELEKYRVQFSVVEAIKGAAPETYSLTTKMRYYEPRYNLDGVVVGGCEGGFAVGNRYLFLLPRSGELDTSWCSSNVHALYRVDMAFVRSLRRDK